METATGSFSLARFQLSFKFPIKCGNRRRSGAAGQPPISVMTLAFIIKAARLQMGLWSGFKLEEQNTVCLQHGSPSKTAAQTTTVAYFLLEKDLQVCSVSQFTMLTKPAVMETNRQNQLAENVQIHTHTQTHKSFIDKTNTNITALPHCNPLKQLSESLRMS